LQVYAHVIPAMDRQAADSVAELILTDRNRDGTILGTNDGQQAQEKTLTWAEAQVSDGSGGRI
jgi:hypothetical protein